MKFLYSNSLTQLYLHYLGQILGFWVTCGVKMMYIMVEADGKIKLLPATTSYMYKVFELIDMLSMGIWQ
jgi:hypothetical protein